VKYFGHIGVKTWYLLEVGDTGMPAIDFLL